MSSSSRTVMCWCHQCSCSVSVRVGRGEGMICPVCNGGFVEEIDEDQHRHGVFPAMQMRWGVPRMRERRGVPPPPPHQMMQMEMMEAMNALMSGMDPNSSFVHGGGSSRVLRFGRVPPPSASSDPMVLVRGLSHGLMEEDGGVEVFLDELHRHHHHHHHHHHHGSIFGGSARRRHHAHMGDFAVEHLIRQLASATAGDGGQGDRCGPPPAARSAVEAMPTVKITQKHLSVESHCAVCTDPFEIGGEVREMPCKHIYHADCILPWLAQHNSCPVCRHEMPTDDEEYEGGQRESSGPGEGSGHVGLTIWGLPGGGFAVGRFTSSSPSRRGSRNDSSRNSNSSSASSLIFRRGGARGLVSDLGIRNGSGENQGRRNPLSFLWPFRSSNSSESSSSTANPNSSNNNGNSRWWFR
uniref:RING-type E3 ubiquitin transferase n=1 Tax=Araucaria cunninghamii TaxID=56994 RepID=A0A0D6R0C1_ARACU